MKKVIMVGMLGLAMWLIPGFAWALEASSSCANLPTLQNFTVSNSFCANNEVYVELTPVGDPGFYLYLQLFAGKTYVWCDGDEKLCKAVGSGKDCVGDEEGWIGSVQEPWCYAGSNEPLTPSDPGVEVGPPAGGCGPCAYWNGQECVYMLC